MDAQVQNLQPNNARVVFRSDGLDHSMGNDICKYVVPLGYRDCGGSCRSPDTRNSFVRVDLQNV